MNSNNNIGSYIDFWGRNDNHTYIYILTFTVTPNVLLYNHMLLGN